MPKFQRLDRVYGAKEFFFQGTVLTEFVDLEGVTRYLVITTGGRYVTPKEENVELSRKVPTLKSSL